MLTSRILSILFTRREIHEDTMRPTGSFPQRDFARKTLTWKVASRTNNKTNHTNNTNTNNNNEHIIYLYIYIYDHNNNNNMINNDTNNNKY